MRIKRPVSGAGLVLLPTAVLVFLSGSIFWLTSHRSDMPFSSLLQKLYPRRDRPLTRAEWQEDLEYLARELPRRHKNAFHAISQEQFARAVADLSAQLPALEEHQIEVRLTELVAMIGDGHTVFDFPKTFRYYPLMLYWFGDDLRVIKTTEPYRQALGARLLEIDGMSVNEANERVQRLIPQGESRAFTRYRTYFLVYAEVLHALGIIRDMERVRYTFVDDAGRRFTLVFSPTAQEIEPDWLSPYRDAPLYLQNPDEPFWFTFLPDSQTVYAHFKSYDSFEKNAKILLSFLKSRNPQRLVLDLRRNGGGDFTKARKYLIPDLKQQPSLMEPGHLFVIIGRGTFSAAMVNALDLRRELRAMLVGEPTGGRPNSYSEHGEFKLPNSRLLVSYSTRYYKFQEEDTESVIPDKEINVTWEDYQAGRDTVLDWILNYKPDPQSLLSP